MDVSVADMRITLERRIQEWLGDADSAVEYAEEVEGRWAVRVKQETRDATTIWFTIGERSLWYEAYMFQVGDDASEVFRQALARNTRSWRVFFALDSEGGLVLRGRLPAALVTMFELDLVLGEVYETVEIAFRPLLRTLLEEREKSS